ncbi:hypothetical protein JCM6882_008788 [Rhodosporidiobolus microsporus]
MPLRRPSPSSSTLLFLLSSSLTLAAARTTSFDDRDERLVFAPSTAWRTGENDDGYGTTTTATGRRGATLRATFAGEQISLFGNSSAAFNVSIDGAPTSSASSSSSSSLISTEPVRLFLANELDRETVHQLVLEISGEGTFTIDRIAVAYSNDIDLVPALLTVGASGAVSTATLSSSPSSTSSSSSPASTSSLLSSVVPTSDSGGTGRGPGIVAGIIVGSVGAVALVVFLIFLLIRRRRNRLSPTAAPGLGKVGRNRSSYHNTETGAQHRRRSTPSGFLSAFNFSRHSSLPLPFARSTPSTPLSRSYNDSPYNAPDGGVGRAPAPAPHPFASPIAASYSRRNQPREKEDRLEATKDFYRVPPAVVPGPPPAGPLPSLPGRAPSEEREMEERWRTDGPSLVSSSRAPSRAAAAAPPPQPMTVQVFGEAMSDYAASDEAHAPTESSGGGGGGGGRAQRRSVVAFPSLASGRQHLRRRSWRQEEDGAGAGTPFSVPLAEGDMPLRPLPPAATAAGRARAPKTSSTSFRNPFSSAASLASHSHSNSTPSSKGHFVGASGTFDPRRFSSSSSDAEHASVEGAQIMAVSATPSPNDDDTPLYAYGIGVAPVRMSSLRELHETVRAGPRGDVSRSEVVKPAATVARRPTLTRRGVGGEGGSERTITPGPRPVTTATVRPEDVVPEGYEEEEVVLSEEEQRRAKHQSVAALIETVESFDELLDGGANGGHSRRGSSSRDPPPGEEDRSAFFARRERMPRYSAEGGDPRRVEWGDGSISRR